MFIDWQTSIMVKLISKLIKKQNFPKWAIEYAGWARMIQGAEGASSAIGVNFFLFF